ncbi:MAG: hypothetical protein NTW78_10540, partial [Campylobacterales bacterium]|nr:hypothetical protein [Campylobacterales bacterium]
TFVGDGTRFIYLWKDPKGNVRYSFNLLDSKPYSAKIANINSVLNEHFYFKFRIEVTNDPLRHINTRKALLENIFRTNSQMYKLYREIVTQNIKNHQNSQINQNYTSNADDIVAAVGLDVNFKDVLETEVDEDGEYKDIQPPQQLTNQQGNMSSTPTSNNVALANIESVSVLVDSGNNLIAKWVGDGYLDIHYGKLSYYVQLNAFVNSQNQIVFQWQSENVFMDSTSQRYFHYSLPSIDPRLNAINPQQPSKALQPQNTIYNQEQIGFLNEKAQLIEQQLEFEKNTRYLYTEQFPTVHKEVFEPFMKSTFFIGKNNLLHKNSYTPSVYMVQSFDSLQQNYSEDSIILRFILAMANNNFDKAKDIFLWLARSFLTLQKERVALVLCSKNDIYSNLFYKWIVEPLFNEEYCVEINNDILQQKKIATVLENKVIYHFKDIATATFLNAPIKELADTLLNCDTYTLHNKKINAKASILISSSSKHIPLIANNIAAVVVDVNHNIDDFRDEMSSIGKFAMTKHHIAELIKQDLDNFAAILRSINVVSLYEIYYSKTYYKKNHDNQNTTDQAGEFEESIVDGDAEILELFWLALVNKDVIKFDKLRKTNKNVYNVLISDFVEDRILSINLEKYFPAMFGEGIYRSNRAILKASRGQNLLDKYVKKHKIGDKDYYYILEKYLD